MKALNIVLDVIAGLFLIAAIIPVGYIVIVASIFLGVEWYEWLALGLVGLFVAWRLWRFDA